ncbi:hypothetical protein K9L16_03275 [Candidatus Pacearchaeota archaeon]|nr:hypothetical protein [Candidatus Pacearchaeota archaeon]
MRGKILQSKKAVSPIIGYILLISIAITLSVIAYGYMKTFVPKDQVACPDGTSLFIQEYSYTYPSLEIDFRNNGRFGIAGFYIKATTDPEQDIATKDLANFLISGGTQVDKIILFNASEQNSLSPGDIKNLRFAIDEPVYKIELIPIRYEDAGGRQTLTSCTRAVIRENL